MEFWGVEVKSGQSLSVDPGEDMIMHISQVALGENKNNGGESVKVYVKVGDQKLIIGTLSQEKIPHLSTEIVVEKSFELSHSWKHGSVYFTGYKVDASESDDEDMSDDELAVATDKEPAVAKSSGKKVNFQLPDEDAKAKEDDDDSDEESEDESDDDTEDSGDEKEKKITAEVDDSDEDDEDESSDDETPVKAEVPKKRSGEATTSKDAVSNKKAKFVTPQKTETKKPHVHIATPYPSKQGARNSGSNGEASKQQQTPKSGGAFGCNSCNRSFTSEMGLQSHTKAKHSAAA